MYSTSSESPRNNNSNIKKAKSSSSFHITLGSILAFTIGFLMSYDAAMQHQAIIGGNAPEDMNEKHITTNGDQQSASGVLPTTTLEILGMLYIKQKQTFNRLLASEYGRFSNTFNTENLDRIFNLSPISKKRLIRKLMMKILLGRIQHGKDSSQIEIRDDKPILRWVTIGDSAAAGYGNAFAHSYTSILQETVSDIFASAGIEFQATNHAGDAWSGLELGLCLNTIVGKDVDVISWDFMRLDSSLFSETENYEDPLSSSQGIHSFLFGERAGQTLSLLPFLFYVGLSSDGYDNIQTLETSGMGVDILGEQALNDLIATTFPNYNKVPRDIAPAINKLNCDSIIEGKERCNDASQLNWCHSKIGEACAAEKYLTDTCADDRYQTPYNDGWKMHRLKGRLIGFHLVDMLRQAAIELDILERERPQFRINPLAALNVLRADEEVEQFLFFKTHSSSRIYNNGGGSSNKLLQSWDALKQKHVMCVNAKISSMNDEVQQPTDALYNYEFVPSNLCEDYLGFQNVYIRIGKEDGWVSILNPTFEMQDVVPKEGSIALVLCFKQLCYGNQQCFAYEVDMTNVEVRMNDVLFSDIKGIGDCYILQDDTAAVSSFGEVKIRTTHSGDEPLLLSSALILYDESIPF